jgi:hypothetical protein
MGQRNPAPVENGGLSHDFVWVSKVSTILLVVQDLQDFPGPSTVQFSNGNILSGFFGPNDGDSGIQSDVVPFGNLTVCY